MQRCSPGVVDGLQLGDGRSGRVRVRARVSTLELAAVCGIDDELAQRPGGVCHQHEPSVHAICNQWRAAGVAELDTVD